MILMLMACIGLGEFKVELVASIGHETIDIGEVIVREYWPWHIEMYIDI